MNILDFLENKLIDKCSNEIKSIENLKRENVVIGFYFSASWCEPCPAFTQLLIYFYEDINSRIKKKSHVNNVSLFEIIFVSSDLDEEGFKESSKEMPWWAVPFKERLLRKRISNKFQIKEIPSLVLVEGSSGSMITLRGRDSLSEDLNGENFPWRPQPLLELLGNQFLFRDEYKDFSHRLKDSHLGLYFSSNWCPPGKLLNSKLVEVYEKLKGKEDKKFEVIFVSFDRSSESFQEFSKLMPWLVLPFRDPRIKLLTKHFDVEGIPTLIILDPNFKMVCPNARTALFNDPEAKDFPWPEEKVELLREGHVEEFQHKPCLVFFTEGKEDLIEKAVPLLERASFRYREEWEASLQGFVQLPNLKFFYEGTQSDEVADSIRTFAQIGGRDPLVAILDLEQQKIFSTPENEINEESISNLIEEFKSFVLNEEEKDEEEKK